MEEVHGEATNLEFPSSRGEGLPRLRDLAAADAKALKWAGL